LEIRRNHRRAIGVSLTFLDETLCWLEQWARGREVHSVLYEERNELSDAQRRRMLAEIQAVRRVIRKFRDELGLQGRVQSAKDDIRGRCANMWEHLVALESRYLRRYGAISDELADYMDREVPALISRFLRISAAAAEDGGSG